MLPPIPGERATPADPAVNIKSPSDLGQLEDLANKGGAFLQSFACDASRPSTFWEGEYFCNQGKHCHGASQSSPIIASELVACQ